MHQTRLTSSEERLEVQLRAYMQQDLVNKIIEWKQENSGHEDNYERFLYEMFPENIKTENKTKPPSDADKKKIARRQSSFSGKHVIWIDHRVDNTEWKDQFNRVDASDQIKPLGLPPGLEDDGDDGIYCKAICDDGDDVQIRASDIEGMSVWGKAKLAWQLGVAEVGSINVASLVASETAMTGLKWPVIDMPTMPQISLSSITDSDSDTDSNGDRGGSNSSSDGEESRAAERTRDLVVAFYTNHNQDKLSSVDRIVKRFAGRDAYLLQQWEQKYGFKVQDQQWFKNLDCQPAQSNQA
jgi:hypothetical protein